MPPRLVRLLLPALALLACRNPFAPELRVVPPPCTNPAPLLGSADPRAPGYIIVFVDSVNAQQETNRLATKYSFQASYVYEAALRGFSASLAPEVVAAVRCEPTVRLVEYDGVVSVDG